MKTWALLAILLPLPSYATTLPPGFDLAKYQRLTALASEKGELLQGAGPDGMDYKVLTHLDPADTTKPHKADYFSAVGGADSSGHFGAIEVSMESEDWRKRPNGDWEIEQWMWTAWTDGTLVSVGHYLLVESSSGSVLDDKALPVGQAQDPAELARWESKLEQWYGFTRGF